MSVNPNDPNIRRAALQVQFSQYESEFRRRLDEIKNIVRGDPVHTYRNYTPAQIAEWIAKAEKFSVDMDRLQSELLDATVKFLKESAP